MYFWLFGCVTVIELPNSVRRVQATRERELVHEQVLWLEREICTIIFCQACGQICI